MFKTYFIFNAYEFTNKENKQMVCLQGNLQGKYPSKYPKYFYFTMDELKANGLFDHYEKDIPGVGFLHLYIKTKVKEEVLGASEDQNDLETLEDIRF